MTIAETDLVFLQSERLDDSTSGGGGGVNFHGSLRIGRALEETVAQGVIPLFLVELLRHLGKGVAHSLVSRIFQRRGIGGRLSRNVRP